MKMIFSALLLFGIVAMEAQAQTAVVAGGLTLTTTPVQIPMPGGGPGVKQACNVDATNDVWYSHSVPNPAPYTHGAKPLWHLQPNQLAFCETFSGSLPLWARSAAGTAELTVEGYP